MTWPFLGIASAALLGLYDIFRKAAVDRNAVLPVLWLSTVFSALPFLALLLLGRVDAPDTRTALLLAVKAAIVATSWVLEFFALKHLPLSVAAPIRATQPLFTLLGAVLVFGEQLNAGRWTGVILTLLACGWFTIAGAGSGGFRRPGRHILYAIGATAAGATSSLYDKYLLSTLRLEPLTVQTWYTIFIVALLGLVLALLWHPRRHATTPFAWRWSIPCIGLALAASDALYFQALAQPGSLIAILAAIRRANVIIPFLYAALLLRESSIAPRALALAGILAGAFLMILS